MNNPLKIRIAKSKERYGVEDDKRNQPVTSHLFQILVLAPNDGREYDPSLEQLAYDIREGDCIGSFEKADTQDLKPEEVIPLLFDIGNDGTFFQDEPEEYIETTL
jgi:hypothetical protein